MQSPLSIRRLQTVTWDAASARTDCQHWAQARWLTGAPPYKGALKVPCLRRFAETFGPAAGRRGRVQALQEFKTTSI